MTAAFSYPEARPRYDEQRHPITSRYGREPYGKLPDGRLVFKHRLTNCHGASVEIIDFGATVTSVVVPDGDGRLSDVVLGYDRLESYLSDQYFVGAFGARCDQRSVGDCRVSDGVECQWSPNDNIDKAHGGQIGLGRRLFAAEPFEDDNGSGVLFSLSTADGISTQLSYRFDDTMCLSVEHRTPASRTTVANSYFNLAGSGTILDHDLRILGFEYAPIDARSIPTGELRRVDGSPFDFRWARRIGAQIDAPDEQLRYASGYDHDWVIAGTEGELRLAAELTCKRSGRRMTVRSTEPDLQFHSGNFLPRDGSIMKNGTRFGWREGLCLEPRHFPNRPSQAGSLNTWSRPGESCCSVTRYSFSSF